jgi:hypothetical protein
MPTRSWTRSAVAAAIVVALAVVAPVSASAAAPVGVGDPYYPDAGNPGYDVKHYGLDLSYDPATDVIGGTAVVTATASKKLTSFNLDLDALTVSSVTVNARPASFTRSGGELTITPKSTLKNGLPFITIVRYSGVPVSLDGAGFLATDDGAVVIGQPFVASSWFPVNDHPSDKALYTIQLTVPKGLEAISNGRLISQRDKGDKSVWLWNMDSPMASYLATATIGEFDVSAYRADGIRYWDAIDPDLFAPPVAAHSGASLAYAGQGDNAYKRLQRAITVDAASPELSFWIDRDIEEHWDFAFVEVAPVGTDQWTTLPDTAGILTQSAGAAACIELINQHPFLAHYLSGADDAPCEPSGDTGQWWAATGSADGWEQWTFDLSAYAGEEVAFAITYLTDYTFELAGVSVDDIVAPGGAGSTSFEADADPLDGWTIPGPPAGSPGNVTDWQAPSSGPPSTGEMVENSFARQPEIVEFLEGYFGPYPFHELGGIVDDVTGLGFALENQTRPIYAADFWSTQQDGDSVVVHEIAHQWFGDSVAVDNWSDIWLNEGFATYAEWLWSESEGNGTTQQWFDAYYGNWDADDPFWEVIVGDPGKELLFDPAVYYRGAMTLQALRTTIGDEAFFAILPEWQSTHKNGNASIPEFIALAEQVSGQDLDDFFEAWLYTPSRPDVPATSLRSFDTGHAPKLPAELDLSH